MFSVGRICMKTAGREAGKFCVIVDVVDDKFVMVTGPKAATHVKRRKCNMEHLEPTPEVIKIAKNASDEAVMEAYKKDHIFDKLNAKPPSAQEIAEAKEAEAKRTAGARKEKKEEKAAEAKQEKKEHEEKKAEEKAEHEPEKKSEEKKEEKAAEKPKKKAPAKKKPAAKKAEEKKEEAPA